MADAAAPAPPSPPVDLSRITFESTRNRRRIIASYWFIVILALPLWWRTTSIDRLSLPESRARVLAEKHLSSPVHVELRGSQEQLEHVHTLHHELARWISPVAEANGLSFTAGQGPHTRKAGPGSYNVVLENRQDAVVEGRSLHIGLNEPSAGQRVIDTVTKILVPHVSQTASEEHRVVKYSPRYRLAFSLLNEDASSGRAALSWDVREAVDTYLHGTFDRLSVLHNFTIESQVQYHAPLAFEPRAIHVADNDAHGLTPEDLTVFVNSAEWTLASSSSNDPVLHFVLFVPSSQHSPLYILDHEGQATTSDAFVLPQWGGILVLNSPPSHLTVSELAKTFHTFHRQLLTLLGVPDLPAGVQSRQAEAFTDWQLDALVRQRARQNFENSKDTLNSIVKLVHQIENMPVGEDVQGDVQDALDALDAALEAVPSSSTQALQRSAEALTLSSRAFFNPGMLALLYFPAEHKYAVYAPLFASVAAPLIAAIVREVIAWRKARRAARQPEARARAD
ncbi:GPI transamidase component PIG-S [Phanerochaete sordida]|uniref:GPI transamidase component PIG-S n=1 Tax=Phanerochaete sordida TaxID=48140 RepID=A0A9P3FZX5_9APHY|nr:GPI transamidase component PIG-S [Phanerochaete sordida]